MVSQVSMTIVRQQMNVINWEKQLVSIRGSRGVGKTTLMRQYIKQTYGVNAGEVLYCVMDSMYFTNHTLLEVAERFYLMGGKHLFLDEVHKYPTWSKELKEIIDLWPDLKITFTGSSLLQILNADADLSRRVLEDGKFCKPADRYCPHYSIFHLKNMTAVQCLYRIAGIHETIALPYRS